MVLMACNSWNLLAEAEVGSKQAADPLAAPEQMVQFADIETTDP
jgi:hypothetical protein